jgi:hypothetical protein
MRGLATFQGWHSGTAVAGPQCPVHIMGRSCPPRPVSVAVTVADASGRTVISSISAADGRFRVSLAPGTYTLLARGPNQPQLLRPVAVSVEAGRYADLRLFLDTGIR